MTYTLIIPGQLPCFNDYSKAERTHYRKAAKMKSEKETFIMWQIRSQLGNVKIITPVVMRYRWYEPNKKRDLDGISSMGRKFIQDALVKAEVLGNDGWKNIIGFTDEFFVDRAKPRVEVVIVEV